MPKSFDKLKAEKGVKGKSLMKNDYNQLTDEHKEDLRKHVEDDHDSMGLDYGKDPLKTA